MLGLSYVTRYAGMDATLGVAFAETGVLYPFFAAMLGWLGVFLTGTDAGSNALFGSLQKITATEVWNDHGDGAMSNLTLEQAQVLICTANSTGGVMGKMIDAQSICVATAATNQVGREADIFKAVIWHSIILACIVGADDRAAGVRLAVHADGAALNSGQWTVISSQSQSDATRRFSHDPTSSHLFLLALLSSLAVAGPGKYNKVLAPGDKAPAWENLEGTDGKKHSLADLKDKDVVVVMFTCNSCPVAVGLRAADPRVRREVRG